MNPKHLAALLMLALLSACGGGMQLGGGPSPELDDWPDARAESLRYGRAERLRRHRDP